MLSALEEIGLSDVDSDSDNENDNKKAKEVDFTGMCFMASSEELIDDDDLYSDPDEVKPSYADLSRAVLKLTNELKKYKKKVKKHDLVVDSLNSEINRLKATIPDSKSCESCQVLHSELKVARSIHAEFEELKLAHDSCDDKLKLAYVEIEKLKSSSICLESSILNTQIKTSSNCELLEARLKSSQESIQQLLYHETLSCTNCPKITTEIEALTRQLNEFAEKEKMSQCSASKKTENGYVKCTICPKLTKENEYLKDTLERFTFGKKNLNMILDRSKLSTKSQGLGFNSAEHAKNHPPKILKLLEPGKFEIETEPKQVLFKSAGFAKDPYLKVNIVKIETAISFQGKYQCTHCGKEGHLVQYCFRKAKEEKRDRLRKYFQVSCHRSVSSKQIAVAFTRAVIPAPKQRYDRQTPENRKTCVTPVRCVSQYWVPKSYLTNSSTVRPILS